MTYLKKIQFKITVSAVRAYLHALHTVSAPKGGEKAFLIFSKPRKGRLNETETEFLKTAKWESLDITIPNNSPFTVQTYHWSGEKQAILLAHGWESNSARWKPLISKLQKQGHTIIALDAPAHGATSGSVFVPIDYAACIAEVIEKYKPVALVGHSVGGYAAAYSIAHFKTPSVKKLILLATPSNLNQIFDAFLNFLKLSPKLHRAFYHHIKKKYGKTSEEFALEHFADKIQATGLIIHDTQDELIQPNDAKIIQKSWGKAELIMTEGLGHRLRDEKVYKAILNFLV